MSPTALSTLDVRRPHAHVAEVWLNRPDVRNAFNETVIAELTQVFSDLSHDPSVRVVLLGGHGKAFCAGADLNWMRAMSDHNRAQNQADAEALAHMLWTLHQCPVPIVGRLHGDCFAGGVGLAALCDVVLASESVQFSLSEVKLGLIPATIAPYVMRAIGARAAQRYFLTAERFDAQQAQHMGLVHEVCESAQLDARVQAVVDAIVGNAPQAVRAAKRLVHTLAGQDIDEALRAHTVKLIADVRSSDEGKQGVSAFLQKSSPPWLA